MAGLLRAEMTVHWFASLFSLFLPLILLLADPAVGQAPVERDLPVLLAFKSSADARGASLSSWEGTEPCSGAWRGIRCRGGRVVGVVLDGAFLFGGISSILRLPFLEILSLRRNAFSGTIGAMTALRNPRLRYLFLSHNQFNGSLEISLPALVSLRLEGNGFSGDLRGLHLPNLQYFNVSGNSLSGEIPGDLSKFPASAFVLNPSLCGDPLPRCATTPPIRVSRSSPSPTPSIARVCTGDALNKLRHLVVLAATSGDVIIVSVILAVAAGMYVWICRRNGADRRTVEDTSRVPETDREAGSESDEKKRDAAGLVCFEGGEHLRLECLLKASAEVLGEGDAGGTYKAVLDDGVAVAVKRLDVSRFPAGKVFDQQMRLIGMVRHKNLVSLRAYYNSREEKLLVYDYLAGGSLRSLLQNRRGYARSGGRALDWSSRKRILVGAAQGLDFIHSFPARSPLIHANLKPSNVLIDAGGEACVSEWGLMHIAWSVRRPSPSSRQPGLALSPEADGSPATAAGWHRYRAPELLTGKRATQASDVYSFGMVLLEVVTDKEIGDGEAEEEVMRMVKIGMMCTKENPEERPPMSGVLRLISDLL